MALILPYRNVSPTIDSSVYLALTAMVAGDVEIGANSSVWFGAVVRGDVNFIRIGENTNIQDGAVIHVSRKTGGQTIVGNNVTIGHQALLHACTIGDNCLIGMQACVLDGAVVENGAMVGAGALVPPGKIVRNNELWLGRPAKFVRHLTPDDHAHMAENVTEYLKVAASYKYSE